MPDEVMYTSKVRIERVKGPLRRAFVPGEEEPDQTLEASDDPSDVIERASR